MKRVFVAGHPIEANFVKDLLTEGGILAEVQGDDTRPSVWITDDRKLKDALDLVAGYIRDLIPLDPDSSFRL